MRGRGRKTCTVNQNCGNEGGTTLEAQTRIFGGARAKALLSLLVAFAALLMSGNALAAGPSITSDQADYAPGSTVTLTGAGWAVGEKVNLYVNDDQNQTWSESHDVVAGVDGSFTDQFTLPSYFIAMYTATAMGLTSGTASTTFTDGNLTFNAVAPAPTSWAISYTKYGSNQNPNIACTGAGVSGSMVVSGTTPQNLQGGIGQNESVKLGSVTTAEAFAFTGWTNQNNLAVGPTACIAGSNGNGNVADLTAHFTSTAPANQAPAVAATNATVSAAEGSNATNGGTWSDANSGDNVTLTASVGSVAKAGSNQAGTWSWSLGTSAGPAGPTTVTITANDGKGGSTQTTFSYSVTNVTPAVTAAANQTATVGASSAFSLGSFTDPGLDSPWSVDVDWGDGTTHTAFTANAVGALAAQSHTYASAAGSPYSVTVKVTDQDGSSDSRTFAVSVSKADQQALTVTSPTSGAYGDALTPTASGGSGTGAVTFTASGTACAMGSGADAAKVLITSGTGTCSITAHKAADSFFNAADSAAQVVTVSRKEVAVTPDSGQSKLYGAADPTLTFTNDGGLEVGDFTGTLARAAGSNVGSYAIDLGTLAAGGNYNLSLSAPTVNFTITAKPVTITPDSAQGKVYGASDPALTFTNNGGLAAADFTGALGRAAGDSVGTYAITLGDLSAGTNYDLTLAATTVDFTIRKRTLTISAENTSKLYGAENPVFTGSIVGVQNSDPVTLSFTTAADNSSGVGSYAIVPHANGGEAVLANYDVEAANGTLTVSKAPLSASAADKTKVYGDANPVFTGSLTGVQNSDPVTLSFTAGATAASSVGSYDIMPVVNATPGVLSNYEVPALTNGTLTVTQAPLSAMAADKTKVYGDANPSFTGTLSGVRNSDAVTASYSTAATLATDVGTYDIVATINGAAAVLANYQTPNLTNGTLTITKAPLSAKADDKTKILNAANPTFTGTSTGIKNSDPVTLTFTTTATQSSPVGTYPIVPVANGTAAVLANYQTPIMTNGTLTILFGWNGFLQPINDTAHQTGVLQSKFKLGQTIPVKFALRDAGGNVVQQATNPTFTRTTSAAPCDSTTQLETVNEALTPDGATVYTWDGNQYHYNWSTKGLFPGEYRIYASLADGTRPYVEICLTK